MGKPAAVHEMIQPKPLGRQRPIRAIAFSMDRALQLDALLASFFRHIPDSYLVDMTVLYRASSSRYEEQYQVLAQTYGSAVSFVPEVDLRSQVLDLLNRGGLVDPARPSKDPGTHPQREAEGKTGVSQGGAEYGLFLVDDALLVKQFTLAVAQAALDENPETLGLSLRLGHNTTRSYVLNRQQAMPAFGEAGPGILKFDWTTGDGDFGYPLEVSSSMYRLQDLLPLMGNLEFRDPNTLESAMSVQAKRFRRQKPKLLCPQQSVAFSAPVNRVQTVFANRSGADPQLSIEELADKFDEGMRIDVAQLDGFTPSACHQEVELPFEPRA